MVKRFHGTKHLARIIEFHNKYADVFITNEQTFSGEKNKVQWLPAQLILKTMQILKNN